MKAALLALIALVLLVGATRSAEAGWGDGEDLSCAGEEAGGCGENGCEYYGCKNPDGTDTYSCDAGHGRKRRGPGGLITTLGIFAFVGYRIRRKRRNR